MARAKIVYDYQADCTKLVSELQKARKQITGMSDDMKLIKYDAIVNLGERAFQAGRQIYDFAKSVASAANDIERNAKTLNMSTDSYQKWVYAAKMADVGQETLMNGMKFLTKSMSEANQGTGDAAQAFNLLGINLKDSSGKTKDQQIVLEEVISALGKFQDGADKDALSLAILGRSWMTLKPLIDAGTGSIKGWIEEAKRNGIIVTDSMIKAGSEAENTFKRLGARFEATKLQLAPLATAFGTFLENIIKMGEEIKKEGALVVIVRHVQELATKTEEGLTDQEKWQMQTYGYTEEHLRSMRGPYGLRMEGGQLVGAGKESFSGTAYETPPASYYATAAPRMARKGDFPDYESITRDLKAFELEGERNWELQKATNITYREQEGYIPIDKLREMNVELATMEATASTWAKEGGYEMFGYEGMTTPILKKVDAQDREAEVMLRLKAEYADLTGNTRLQIEADREQTELTIQRLGLYGQEADTMRMVAAERQRQMTDTYKFTQDLNKGMENSFSHFFTSVFDKTKSWKDKMSDLFKDLANSFIKALIDMEAKALTTSLTGQSGGGGGINWGSLISGIGGLFSSSNTPATSSVGMNWGGMSSYAEGGLALTPQIASIAEGGPEAVIPLDRFEGSNQKDDRPPSVTNINIMTLDVSTMEQWVRKNSKMFVDVAVDNIRRGGQLGKAVRGA